jgi:hypothetical protein
MVARPEERQLFRGCYSQLGIRLGEMAYSRVMEGED